MPIKTIEDNISLQETIHNFDKEIRHFILIEIVNKVFSFTLEYQNGKLSKCDSKQMTMEKAFNIASYGIPIEISYDEEPVLVYGFVHRTPNGEEAVVTDLSLPDSKIVYYLDRLNALDVLGFKTAEYLETNRKEILKDLGDVHKLRMIGKQIMVIPNYQINNNLNNWPLIIK